MANHSLPDNYTGMILKRSFVAFIVILFFCDIAIYLSLAVSVHLQPQYWIGLLIILGGVLAWFSPQVRWEVFRTPVFFWCVSFLALTLIFFVVVPSSHIEQLKERIRDVVLLTAFLGVFLMLRADIPFARKLVFLAVAIGVLINLTSLVHNNFLRPPHIDTPYQPAGFYINPNESAIALILGAIVSVSLLPGRWRALYMVFVLAGVAATFSREGVLGWLLVVVSFCILGIVRWKHLLIVVVAFVVLAAFLSVVIAKTDVIHEASLYYYSHSGIHKFTDLLHGGAHDESIKVRWEVLQKGWSIFLAHPWFGNGIGSTYHWSLPVSTHNMYLLYMDDYGIIGLFLYPLLIWCMIRKAAGETRKIVWIMAIFLLFWGLFDHNIVQNYYSLFAISLTAAMSKISAGEGAKQAAPIPSEVGSG